MRGYTERTKKLRQESVTTQPIVSLERALLETEFYQKNYGNLEIPILRALNFKNLMVFGFTENIHELYKISTCMITKSGGITLSEALAVQLPLIIYKPVPGQEKENALYFEKKGAAFIANNADEIVNRTLDLIGNHTILTAMRKNMKKMYNKSSSEIIVEDVVESVESM